MAGKDEDKPNGLSTHDRQILYVDLRHYFERLLQEHAKIHASDQQALSVALEAMNQRLATMNEFRGSLEDMTRQMVKRDMFDIVTDRLSVVENTYVKGKDYQEDQRRKDLQINKDFDEGHRRTEALERTIVGRENFAAMADRIVALEKNAVTHEALTAQRNESERSRKTFTLALVVVGLAALINFLLNVYQAAPGG